MKLSLYFILFKIIFNCYFKGADYIEFDVHLSKDNIPVIYHDFTTCLVVDKVSN